MSNEINYRSKYEQLKAQFMASVDTAFRLGYEQGAQEAQIEGIQSQQQQAQAEQQPAGAPGQQPGQPGQEEAAQPSQDQSEQPEQEDMQESENPAGSELDQHISTLEGMLGKSEFSGEDLQKALKEVKSFKEKLAIKKNDKAIKSIAKSLKKKPAFAIGNNASHNLNDVQKNALSMQEKIVGDVMKSWEIEEQKASKNIFNILATESLTKKE